MNIDNLEKRYKELVIKIDDLTAKCATSYEESTICIQDNSAINAIKWLNDKNDQLASDVNYAHKYSSDVDYTDTTASLEEVKTSIESFKEELNTLSIEVLSQSQSVYEKLITSFNKYLDESYPNYKEKIDGYFENYNNAIKNINRCKENINNNFDVETYKKLLNKAAATAEERKRDIASELNDLESKVIVEMEKLLNDGLQKVYPTGTL